MTPLAPNVPQQFTDEPFCTVGLGHTEISNVIRLICLAVLL